MIVLNCAALPETLIEAELFGHEAGAFTGATRARMGRFEEADGSTLFLDELATLSAAAQDRLLRAIEYGEVTRIGASRPVSVDVRILAATNDDLPGLVEQNRFRADLLDRLSFEVITLPPLRARGGDVLLLAEHFGRRMATEAGWGEWPGFSDQARSALMAYGWPGNVRELRNVVERAVYRWLLPERPVEEIVFDPFESPWKPRREAQTMMPSAAADTPEQPEVQNLRSAVDAYEHSLIERALISSRWNQRLAASALGVTYDQLRHAMKRHGLIDQALKGGRQPQPQG